MSDVLRHGYLVVFGERQVSRHYASVGIGCREEVSVECQTFDGSSIGVRLCRASVDSHLVCIAIERCAALESELNFSVALRLAVARLIDLLHNEAELSVGLFDGERLTLLRAIGVGHLHNVDASRQFLECVDAARVVIDHGAAVDADGVRSQAVTNIDFDATRCCSMAKHVVHLSYLDVECAIVVHAHSLLVVAVISIHHSVGVEACREVRDDVLVRSRYLLILVDLSAFVPSDSVRRLATANVGDVYLTALLALVHYVGDLFGGRYLSVLGHLYVLGEHTTVVVAHAHVVGASGQTFHVALQLFDRSIQVRPCVFVVFFLSGLAGLFVIYSSGKRRTVQCLNVDRARSIAVADDVGHVAHAECKCTVGASHLRVSGSRAAVVEIGHDDGVVARAEARLILLSLYDARASAYPFERVVA